MVNMCGVCTEDTGSESVFWCSPECYRRSHQEMAQHTYKYYLDRGLYQQADWWRAEYNLPSLMGEK